MPRIKSRAAAPDAAEMQEQRDQNLAAAVGDLGLASSGRGQQNAADDVADAYSGGSAYRAYGHNARVFDLCFHPASSSLLVSASDDCTAGVWRRQAGGTAAGGRYMQVASFQGHADSVMRASWSPDGQMVASGSSDGVVCLWQPAEAALTSRHNLGPAGVRQLGTLGGHPEEVYACLFLPAGSSSTGGGSSSDGGSTGSPAHRLLTASGECLFLWDLATQQQIQQVQPPPPPDTAAAVPERWRPGYLFGVAAQPDGPLLGAACSDGRLRLWARQGGDHSIQPLCTLPWNQAMGADCCFGPNGLFCAVSKDGSLLMMDVRQGTCLHHLQLDCPLLSCTLLPSGGSGGGQCLVAAGADGSVHFVDVTTGDVSSVCPEAGPLRPLLCATLSADGAWLAASGEAVLLGEDDLPGSQRQPAATSGHQPPPKWSPIHLWQRSDG